MCEGVCLCSCQLANMEHGNGSGLLTKRGRTSKWIYRPEEHFVKKLVIIHWECGSHNGPTLTHTHTYAHIHMEIFPS